MHDTNARNQRIEPRVKLFQPATMEGGAGAARVHLLNLSRGGALLHSEAAPQVGELVELSGGLGTARVAWRGERRFGVAFVRALAGAKVAEMLDAQQELYRAFERRLLVN